MCARTLAAIIIAASINLTPTLACGEDTAPVVTATEPNALSGDIGRTTPIPPDNAPALAASSGENCRKATTSPLPSFDEIVTVDWESSSAESEAFLKRTSTAIPFDRHNCPVTEWLPENDVDVAGSSTIGNGIIDAGPSPENSTRDLPSAVIDELRTLDPPSPVETTEVPTHETYVADLMSLLPAQSAWVGMRSGIVDLGPAPPQTHYMDELQALAPVKQQPYRAVSSPRAVRPDELSPRSGQVYSIPKSVPCEVAGDETLTGLFRPLSEVNVNSSSTSPPERPRSVGEDATLQLPPNDACNYLQVAAPGQYFTPTRFGVARPNRNTFPFCNNPLYFEDPNLERCGRSYGCLTTLHSATRFAGRLAILPYLSTAEPPCCKVRALPDCPTCSEFGHDAEYPGWSWKAAAVQAGAVTGIIYIIP